MRSLIIAQTAILDPSQSVEGIYSRVRMLVAAMARISTEMDYLVLLSQQDIERQPELAALNAAQSAYWGLPVRMDLVRIADRRNSRWQHYGAGMFSAAAQPTHAQYARPDQVQAVAAQLDRKPDIVLVIGLSAMNAVMTSGRRPDTLFFDLNDIQHTFILRSSLTRPFWIGKLLYLTHVPAVLLAERRAARMARVTLVCSDVDRDYLRRIGMGGRIESVPNALAFPPVLSALTDAPTLLFLGGYNYVPNREAAQRLITRIWPLILAAMPQARLIVAGRHAETIPAFAGKPANVEFTGFVDALAPLYDRSRVVVCPIMVGGGTRVKLVEAASYGKPMVSTAIGAEGLALRDGREILLRDDDAGFAAACVDLLRDDARATALGQAARAAAMDRYELGAVQDRLAALLASVARQHSAQSRHGG